MRYSFVTVFFETEFLLLELQARSLALFASAELVGEILVINNGRRSLSPTQVSTLAAAYRGLFPLVRFLSAEEICVMPIASGWDSQQVLKLAVSDVVSNERYVMLDAKTHLIAGLSSAFLEVADGRARANVIDYSVNPQRYALERACRFFNVNSGPHVLRSLDSITPFVFHTLSVRQMTRSLSNKYGLPFPKLFMREGFSEFTLYSVWLGEVSENPGIDLLYEFHQSFPAIIWGDGVDASAVARAIKKARGSENPFFSSHRRAFAGFSPPAAQLLAEFWTERQLFSDLGAAQDFIGRVAQQVRRSQFTAKTEQLILRPVYLARRVASRIRSAISSWRDSSPKVKEDTL